MNESNERGAFRDLLSLVCDQLYCAAAHLKIFEGLHPSEEYDIVLMGYSGFFNFARLAHRQSFYICMANVLNESDPRAPSLYQLLDKIKGSPSLAPALQPEDIGRELKLSQEIINQLTIMRHQRMAHYDINEKPDPVSWEASCYLLSKCQEIFNKISLAVTRQTFGFELSDPKNDLVALMRALIRVTGDSAPLKGGLDRALSAAYWDSTGLPRPS